MSEWGANGPANGSFLNDPCPLDGLLQQIIVDSHNLGFTTVPGTLLNPNLHLVHFLGVEGRLNKVNSIHDSFLML